MDFRRGERSIYLRIDKYEEAIETIIKLCCLEEIEGASLQGIGACDKVVVAGHVKEAHISYTGEIVLDVCDHKIERMFSEAAGIDVWKVSSSTIDS